MIEKETAINILEDIERCLYDDEWKHKTLSSVEQYIKGLEIAVDDDIDILVKNDKIATVKTKTLPTLKSITSLKPLISSLIDPTSSPSLKPANILIPKTIGIIAVIAIIVIILIFLIQKGYCIF